MKECSHDAFTGVGIRSLLTLNDACGDADSTNFTTNVANALLNLLSQSTLWQWRLSNL